MKEVKKPWGYELIWAKTQTYVGKILYIKKLGQLSLQYHKEKEESIFLYSGKMEFLIENESGELIKKLLQPGQAYHIPAGKKHRMIALEECQVFEVSTPQLDDVIRLEDNYGRV